MTREILQKQLIYRSTHRGCKETDILLGKFVEKKIFEFDDEKLEIYQKFIVEDDMLIYDWILRKVEVPQEYLVLVEEIREFHNI